MCGICGVFGLTEPPDITPMVRAMRHRGPDDSGQHRDARACLGMTRLAVLDLSERGHQPMCNRDGSVWIVFNGEVYNFRELRSRLEQGGRSFSTGTDTEVVLALYEAHGEAFLPMLRGMFALAILDKRDGPGRERLLMARDPFGIKPLLWAETNGALVFASEMKAVLASGLIAPRLDPEALRRLLALGSIPQPGTAVEGVNMLLPGWMLTAHANGQRNLSQWWSLGRDREPGLRQAPYREQVVRVRQALEESVRLQLVSDVPVGAFLSGGVDSAVLVALMGRVFGHPVKTFSVGFGQEGAHLDETADALAMARHIGTDHHRVEVSGQDVRDSIHDIVDALDQPTVDGVNSYFVCRAARGEVTVAISGTGGDELFCGYPWFANMAVWESGRRALSLANLIERASLWSAFDPLAGGRLGPRLERLRSRAGFLARFAREYFIFGPDQTARLLGPAVRRHSRAGRDPSLDGHFAGGLPPWSPVERVSALCLRGYTQNQLLRDIDCVSMAHSLEVRVPFLDPVLTDLALSLPDDTKLAPAALLRDPSAVTYRQRGIKRILLDACRDLLPEDIDLQAKRGFAMPFDDWLRGPLRDVLQDALSPESIRARGIFDPKETAKVTDHFLNGRSTWPFAWLLMIVELWCRRMLDRP